MRSYTGSISSRASCASAVWRSSACATCCAGLRRRGISRTYVDDCLERLASENAALGEQVEILAERGVCAEADRDAFRRVAVAALYRAHDPDVELIEFRERYRRALDDAREMRAYLLQGDGRIRAA